MLHFLGYEKGGYYYLPRYRFPGDIVAAVDKEGTFWEAHPPTLKKLVHNPPEILIKEAYESIFYDVYVKLANIRVKHSVPNLTHLIKNFYHLNFIPDHVRFRL